MHTRNDNTAQQSFFSFFKRFSCFTILTLFSIFPNHLLRKLSLFLTYVLIFSFCITMVLPDRNNKLEDAIKLRIFKNNPHIEILNEA